MDNQDLYGAQLLLLSAVETPDILLSFPTFSFGICCSFFKLRPVEPTISNSLQKIDGF